ncbi:MAG: hypothetical protein MUF01_11780 [Bryobacterales bacterium]|jgi:hypothetical protein|nr:hypothetical protein [Bryobacterales bacterium]
MNFLVVKNKRDFVDATNGGMDGHNSVSRANAVQFQSQRHALLSAQTRRGNTQTRRGHNTDAPLSE